MKGVDFSVIYMYISYIGIFVGQMVTRHPWGIGLEKKHPLRGHDEVMFLYETIEMYLNTAAADSGRPFVVISFRHVRCVLWGVFAKVSSFVF